MTITVKKWVILTVFSCVLTSPVCAKNVYFGLSPFLTSQEEKNQIWLKLSETVEKTLVAGDQIYVFNADTIETLASFTLTSTTHKRRRLREIRTDLIPVKRFIQQVKTSPTHTGTVRYPEALNYVRERAVAESSAVLVLYGNPLYTSSKEQVFMTNGYPSDGYILSNDTQSIFGTKNKPNALKNTVVHIYYPKAVQAQWINNRHEKLISRFYALHIAQQGGKLLTFTNDLSSLPLRASNPGLPPITYQIDHTQSFIQMLSIDTEEEDWMLAEPSAESKSKRHRGKLKIGIKWTGNCDIDLYCKPNPNATELSYKNRVTEYGWFEKDMRTLPETQYGFEKVFIPKEVSLKDVVMVLNLNKNGTRRCPKVEVRIFFDNKLYVKQFSFDSPIASTSGHRSLKEGWMAIDIQKIIGV